MAWSFDRAVYLFGTGLEAALQDAADGAKNKGQSAQRQMRVLAKWLGRKMQYRDPAKSSKAEPKAVEASSEAPGPATL